MKKTIFLLIAVFITMFSFSKGVFALEKDSLIWNSETGKMESSIESGTIENVYNIWKNGTGFTAQAYKYVFNFEKNKNFNLDISINVKDSNVKSSLFNFAFEGNFCGVMYLSSKLYVCSVQFLIDLANESDLKLNFKYDVETSTLSFTSSNYEEIKGNVSRDTLLKSIVFSNTTNLNSYNSFSLSFFDGESSKKDLFLYDFVKDVVGELPENFEFVYAILTVLLFVVLIFGASVPFIIVFKVWS